MTLAGSCRDSGSSLRCGSYLSNHCITLSCIAAHGRLAGCADNVGLGSTSVYLRICLHAGAWQSSRFEDHPEIWRIPRGARRKGLAQICMKEPRLKNKRQEQEGNIFSCAACVSVGSPLLKCLSRLFKAFATGNLNELCALQHLPTGSRRRKNTDLRFSACTWCASNILQFFSRKVIHPRKLHKHHLSQHRT